MLRNFKSYILVGLLSTTMTVFVACSKKTAKTPTPPAPQSKKDEPTNTPPNLAKPIVLMISIDGFRHDYLELHAKQTENLNRIAKQGLRTESMRPTFPSLTFPNHTTLVTGRPAGRHGIVSNTFFDESYKDKEETAEREDKYSPFGTDAKGSVNDPKWYLAEPIWVLARNAGMVTAICYWVGSEVPFGGKLPDHVVKYGSIGGEDKEEKEVDKVITWLELADTKRPHFIGLYFSEVDHQGHTKGTTSVEVAKAIEKIDKAIGRLDKYIDEKKLPVNILIMSDHGMQDLDKEKFVAVGDLVDLSAFTVGDTGGVMNLYTKNDSKVEKTFNDLKKVEKDNHFIAYKRGDKQLETHGYDDPNRVGDIVLVAELPYYLKNKITGPHGNVATHGWNPSDAKNKSMHAFFIAKGPNIKKGVTGPTFDNIHVFPFAMRILGLESKGLGREGTEEALAPYLESMN